MAQRYQLPCEKCQTRILVETTQAGQVVACPGCQHPVTLGTLREIRNLEAAGLSAEEKALEAKSRSQMTSGSRLMFVLGTLLFSIAGIWGLLSMLKANQLYAEKPETKIDEQLIQNIQTAPPADMLEIWEQVSDDAVSEWREHPFHKVRKHSRENRMYSYVGFGLAGIGLLAMIGAFVLKL